ncbi:MAG: serine/threonine-protein phosphatase [Myxococcales bacterium]|nr:serine/threonine-protein phosphatase [Myxococcales bacterium]
MTDPNLNVSEAPLGREVAGLTDPGRVRSRNEDQFIAAVYRPELSVLATGLPVEVQSTPDLEEHDLLVAVADGMGGHGGGDVASRLAIESVLDAFTAVEPSSWTIETFIDRIKAAVREAEKRLDGSSGQQPNMGTTLTVAVVSGLEVFIGHAGDTRAYRLHNGELEQLTTDHTLAEQLRDEIEGLDEDPSSPMHNILYNALQANSPRPAHIDVLHAEFQRGDGLVLCSDGLVKEIDTEEMTRILVSSASPQERVGGELVVAAREAGGTDNITAVWVRV